MSMPGVPELLIIMVIVLLIFGGSRLAGVGRSLGTAISEFKGAVRGEEEKDKAAAAAAAASVNNNHPID